MSDADPKDYTAEAMLGEDASSLMSSETSEEEKEDTKATPEETGSEQAAETTEEQGGEGQPTEEEESEEGESKQAAEDVNQVFQELGLSGQYRDVVDVLKRTRENMGYITRLEQEIAANRARSAESAPPEKPAQPEVKVDADALLDNPEMALSQLGFVKEADVEKRLEARVQQILDDEKATQFVDRLNKTPEERAILQEMTSLYATMPYLEKLPKTQALQVLYDLAKARKVQATRQPATEPANSEKRERAKTSGGTSGNTSRKGGKPKYTPADLEKMSPEQIEKVIGFGDT